MSCPKRKPARTSRATKLDPLAGDPFFGAFVGRKVAHITAAYMDPGQRGTMMLTVEFADGSRLGVETDRPLHAQWIVRGSLSDPHWQTFVPLPREVRP